MLRPRPVSVRRRLRTSHAGLCAGEERLPPRAVVVGVMLIPLDTLRTEPLERCHAGDE
jgi:hypothetical protein